MCGLNVTEWLNLMDQKEAKPNETTVHLLLSVFQYHRKTHDFKSFQKNVRFVKTELSELTSVDEREICSGRECFEYLWTFGHFPVLAQNGVRSYTERSLKLGLGLTLSVCLVIAMIIRVDKKWWGKGGTFLEVEGGAAALGESGRAPCLQSGAAGEWEGFVNSGEFLGSSAEGESCWKNLEESKLAADLGEVRQRSSGVAAASLRKVDSSEVLGAGSSEFCILHLSRLSAQCCGARSSNLTQIGRSSVLSHIKRSSAFVQLRVRPPSSNRAFVRVRPTARSSAFVQLSVRPSYKCSVRPSIGLTLALFVLCAVWVCFSGDDHPLGWEQTLLRRSLWSKSWRILRLRSSLLRNSYRNTCSVRIYGLEELLQALEEKKWRAFGVGRRSNPLEVDSRKSSRGNEKWGFWEIWKSAAFLQNSAKRAYVNGARPIVVGKIERAFARIAFGLKFNILRGVPKFHKAVVPGRECPNFIKPPRVQDPP
ncbi:hypothetical protein LR48_Vigan401s000100 [Vigna angularis]|uniref:Uncharacterized protein n=1 Tax=Phaseolus angularis TaxID=3914 RepID=A0A0L9T9Q4_PHAAN|nr:hypothetical protein LR48_Vigan401s000100 [Vigna angularis]